MAPRKKRKGLLGAASGYDSASDDDYDPQGSGSEDAEEAAAAAPARKRRQGQKQQAARKSAPRQRRPTKTKPDWLVSESPSGSDPDTSQDSDDACTSSADDDHPDFNSSSSGDGASSGSGETLAARQQRLAGQRQRGRRQQARGGTTPNSRSKRAAGRRQATPTAAAAAARAAPSARQRGRGRRSIAAAAAAAAAAGAGEPAAWGELPAAVLGQVFVAVCAQGALPMAPRLACVCSSWAAVVAATPELWHVLDTARLPASANKPCAAAGARGSPAAAQRSKGGKASSSRGGAAAGAAVAATQHQQQQPSTRAEAGLRDWLARGRLRDLRALRLSCAGSGSAQLLSLQDEGPADSWGAPSSSQQAAGGGIGQGAAGGGRQANAGTKLSAGLLLQVAEHCQQLRSISISGVPGLRGSELSGMLLAMPALSELRLSGVRLVTVSGIDECLCSVLEAAAATGTPRLASLVVESCPTLGPKSVRALCAPPCKAAPGQPPGTDGAAPPDSPQAAAPAAAVPPSPAAAEAAAAASPGGALQVRAGPALPHLQVLDLSYSGAATSGRLMQLQLDSMQAALPNLRQLKLSGLGGLYGYTVAARDWAAVPGWPHLTSLHLGCYLSQASGSMRLQAGMSGINDAALLGMAGGSPDLEELDLTACNVTPEGLARLAAAVAAARPPAQLGLQRRPAEPAGPASPPAAGGGAHLGGGGDRHGEPAGAAGDAGATAAAAAGAAAGAAPEGALRIRRLQLNMSSLACDEGLVAVGRLCCDSLEQLVVRGSGPALGDEGVRGLRACSRLESLDVTGSSVSGAGLHDLLSALPPGVLEELLVGSCRSLSRGARQAAVAGVPQLRAYLARAAADGSLHEDQLQRL